MQPRTGSCLCGTIRYEIAGPIRGAEYCHCSMCRKAHGTAFSANAEIDTASFRLLCGSESLNEFPSSPQRRRCFCQRCGASILIRRLDDPTTLAVALGTLDSEPEVRPLRHVFVGSKAAWYEIADPLPRFQVYPGYEPNEPKSTAKAGEKP
jgi:hypothetical protein